MEGVQSVGTSSAGQVTAGISEISQSSTSVTTSIGTFASESGSVSNINSSITKMLQSIGGGLENDELLKALIALIIIAALLQETLKGTGRGSAESLLALGSGRGDPTQYMATSSSFSSYEATTVAYSTTTVSSADAGTADGAELGGRMDVTG